MYNQIVSILSHLSDSLKYRKSVNFLSLSITAWIHRKFMLSNLTLQLSINTFHKYFHTGLNYLLSGNVSIFYFVFHFVFYFVIASCKHNLSMFLENLFTVCRCSLNLNMGRCAYYRPHWVFVK